MIESLPDNEFLKTFFSSPTRSLFGTVGVDPAVEFVALDTGPARAEPHDASARPSPTPIAARSDLLFEEVLADFRFRTPYRDFDRSVGHVATDVKPPLRVAAASGAASEAVEIIRPVFYQMTPRLRGRPHHRQRLDAAARDRAARTPDGGVLVDAVMLDRGPCQRPVQLHPLATSTSTWTASAKR